jgi:hypothetical protein
MFTERQLPSSDYVEKVDLDTIFHSGKAAHGCYPNLQQMENPDIEPKGNHKRGVYLSEVWRFCKICCRKGYMHIRKRWYYVGSGRAAQGGMLIRAIQGANQKYRNSAGPMPLYELLEDDNIGFRVYSLAEWDGITAEPVSEETFDDILLVEALFQVALQTGYGNRASTKFKRLQLAFHGPNPKPVAYYGLNVRSALEDP